MSSPLTGIINDINEERRRQKEKSIAQHRPHAMSIMHELRTKILEAVCKGESQVFVMSWDWVQEEPEKIDGLSKLSSPVPHGHELHGAERLVYEECAKEGLHVAIEAAEPTEGSTSRFLHMYVCL